MENTTTNRYSPHHTHCNYTLRTHDLQRKTQQNSTNIKPSNAHLIMATASAVETTSQSPSEASTRNSSSGVILRRIHSGSGISRSARNF